MVPHATQVIPSALRSFLTISEVDDGDFLAGALFQRKFGSAPPDFGRHLVALYRDDSGAHHVAGYSHMRPFGEVYLSGGSCSNGATIQRMSPAQRDAVYAAGGVWHLVLQYAFHRYANECDAFFGHCGDRRALEVAFGAGFVAAGPEHLIAYWHKPLHENIRRALIAKVAALGPF